jgi:cytoskeletal protein RodZ
MKSCPQCKQTYNDEMLNFCLNDGTMLVQSFNQNQQAETVMMNQPRVTANQPPTFVNQQQTFGNNAPPRKKSKAWMWVLGIVGVLGLGGVVVFVALLGIVASLPDDNTNRNNNNSRTIKSTPDSTPTKSSDNVLKDDLSSWYYNDATVGTASASGDEMIMKSKASDYYFMLTTPDKDFQTANAIAKVTVKNVDNKESKLGFGLLIHCDEKEPGEKDYAFLIDSKTQKYRIIKHIATKESSIINWSGSTAINQGTEYNELEVKDENGSMTFYINGQSVKTIKDSVGNKSGIVGLYVGGGIPIAFSNLEIRK